MQMPILTRQAKLSDLRPYMAHAWILALLFYLGLCAAEAHHMGVPQSISFFLDDMDTYVFFSYFSIDSEHLFCRV